MDRDGRGAGVTIHVHIDRLLLDGVTPGQGGVGQLQDALRSHLAGLLAQPRMGRGAPVVDPTPGAHASTLGEQAAVAVRDALPARLPGSRA